MVSHLFTLHQIMLKFHRQQQVRSRLVGTRSVGRSIVWAQYRLGAINHCDWHNKILKLFLYEGA